MAKKKTGMTTNSARIDTIKHRDTRKNIPTEELRDFVREEEQRPQTVRFSNEVDALDDDSYPLPQYSERPSPAIGSRSKVA